MLFGRYFVECFILIVQFSFCVLKQLCLLKFTIFSGRRGWGVVVLTKVVIGSGHANRGGG